ncbi:MAG: hypothetical protein GF399_07670 [Candidatus Coatesbacteria bacterium]|nr:hypothetical protein [Candidatus Coatesbacteria bacterium]
MEFDAQDPLEEAYPGLDTRYPRRAYRFLLAAVGRIIGALERPRHISGRELLDGLAEYGLQSYGPLVTSVFADWNIQDGLDFGRMVFSLVEAGLLGKTEQDSLDDFADYPRLAGLADEWDPLEDFGPTLETD